MNAHSSDSDPPEEVFSRELVSLIEKAHRDGVAVEKHWACRTGSDTPDWDVEIVRVERPDSDR